MGESRFIVEDDFVFASQEETPLPPQPLIMKKTNSVASINSYNRLPSQPFTLSVLKLDASLFCISLLFLHSFLKISAIKKITLEFRFYFFRC